MIKVIHKEIRIARKVKFKDRNTILLLVMIFFILNTAISRGENVKSEEQGKTKSKFVIDENKTAIRLLDSDGKEIKTIELKEETKQRKVKEKIDGQDLEYEVDDIKGVTGNISKNGQYAAIVLTKLSFAGEILKSSYSKISYVDINNKVLWEKQDIDIDHPEAQISQDGSYVAFIKVLESGASAFVYDKEGKELFKSEPYGNIYDIFLTKNGKFGYINTSFKTKDNRIIGFICFSVDSREIYMLDRSLVPDGWIDISEDGEVIVEKGRIVRLDGRIEKGKVIHRYKFK